MYAVEYVQGVDEYNNPQRQTTKVFGGILIAGSNRRRSSGVMRHCDLAVHSVVEMHVLPMADARQRLYEN